MPIETSRVTELSYSAPLISNIRQILTGLQGFDSMAREIIQNADDRIKRKDYEDALKRLPLPSALVWKGIENKRDPGVTVETVARFKGLEGEVLILWGLDALPSEERLETLYVGISRAKSILALCGSEGACDDVISGR